jgi:transposase
MPFSNAPVSPAVRGRIHAELLAGTPAKQISTTYGVSKKTIYRYRVNLMAYGDVLPASGLRRGPVPLVNEEIQEVHASRATRRYANMEPGHRRLPPFQQDCVHRRGRTIRGRPIRCYYKPDNLQEGDETSTSYKKGGMWTFTL